MPDDRTQCHLCRKWRIRKIGRLHRGHFICGTQCWGAYWQSEWQRWEDERSKPKQATNLLELRRATK